MAAIATENTTFTTGAILSVTEQSDGVYEVNQLDHNDDAAHIPEGFGGAKTIRFKYGPATIKGSVTGKPPGITATISILGIKIGTFKGDLTSGLTVKINIAAAKGSIRLYLEHGKEVWMDLKLKPVFGHEVDHKEKVITI